MNAYFKVTNFFVELLSNYQNNPDYKISGSWLKSIQSDDIYNEYFIMLDGQLKLHPKSQEVPTFLNSELYFDY